MDALELSEKYKLTILQVLEDHGNKYPTLFDITTDQNNELNGVPFESRKELCIELAEKGYIEGIKITNTYKILRPGRELRYLLKLREDNENLKVEVAASVKRTNQFTRINVVMGLFFLLSSVSVQYCNYRVNDKSYLLQQSRLSSDTLIESLRKEQSMLTIRIDSLSNQVLTLKEDSCD